MGGSSKSSSSANTSTTINDDRIAAEGSIVATEGGVINYLSEEALAEALSFAEGSFSQAAGLIEQAFDAIITGQEKAFSQIGNSTNQAFQQSQAAMASQRSEEFQGLKELLSTVSLIAIVGGAIYFMRK